MRLIFYRRQGQFYTLLPWYLRGELVGEFFLPGEKSHAERYPAPPSPHLKIPIHLYGVSNDQAPKKILEKKGHHLFEGTIFLGMFNSQDGLANIFRARPDIDCIYTWLMSRLKIFIFLIIIFEIRRCCSAL